MSLSTNITDVVQRIATEHKAIRTLVNGNAGDLSALTTTAKSNLVVALNELAAQIASASGIDDGAISTSSSWSSSKTVDEVTARIQAAITALVAGAPTALDTLNELAAALTDADSDIAALVTSIDNRVRYDAAQTLTAPQQAQARTNIGAASAADVGDTAANYVATFEAGLV